MKTWQVIWSVIRFRPWLYIVGIISILVIYIGLQIPALVTREFFNMVTEDAPVRFGFWTIIALIAASGLGRIMGHLVLVLSNIPFMFSVAALLQKNMFSHILKRPGARAIPNSPGEAISRFRGDVDEIYLILVWVTDFIGSVLYSIVAIIIMLRINVPITIIAFTPMVFVVFLVNALTR